MSNRSYNKIRKKTCASANCLAAPKQRIALLQGPVGPFFCRLKAKLERNNFDVWRISFNVGDALFSRRKQRVNFRGNIEDWRNWFSEFVSNKQLDYIILFGAERQIHRIAREVATSTDVLVISLEEGYIRPGYVTVELDGNNATSPLAGKLPPEDFTPKNDTALTPVDFNGLRKMFFYAGVYYFVRTLLTFGKRRKLFHRPISLHYEAFYWIRNFFRWITSRIQNSTAIQNLVEHFCEKYYLVPLQVAADGQMQFNALGWNVEKLVIQSINSFANSAPTCCRLVFKLHPMERGHSNCKTLISRVAADLGISNRVDVLETGSLSLLTRHAAGMITINSTSGLSAIYHGTPLMVIGNAIYASDELAWCAHGDPKFDLFWKRSFAAPNALREKYLLWIKEKALIQGDFYSASGIEAACDNFVARFKCAEF